jgi:glycosyltransferase involved in cell wall biosynthesis
MTERSSRLVVAILSETFSPRVGYIQNILPKYLARLGVDVHLLTEDLPPYFQLNDFQKIYGQFTAHDRLTPGAVERINGFTVHVLGHKKILGYMRMQGMLPKLKEVRPHVVQVHTAIGWLPIDAAVGKLLLGYELFTGSHTTASVFPLAQCEKAPWNAERLRALLLRGVPGRIVSWVTEKCYGATVDCADVAARFFGVQKRKLEVCSLGVDTELFRPVSSNGDREARMALRRGLGFADGEIVCIYSGRFTDAKDPLILARAIGKLRRHALPYRGLFLGAGAQELSLRDCAGCVIRPFVPFYELARYFRASDIGVWPKEESMSMLDAAACGIPIVVNDTLQACERIEGNGVMYRYGDVDDMVRVLAELRDDGTRQRLGDCGAQRMCTQFSWDVIARRRLRDYAAAVNGGTKA